MKKILSHLSIIICSLLILVGEAALAQNSERTYTINSGSMQMTVYPLPAKTNVNVYLSPALSAVTEKIEIINISGRKVLEQKLMTKNTNQVAFRNISNQAAGIYMILAKDSNGKLLVSSKMVISR